jgi:hypothetical protein
MTATPKWHLSNLLAFDGQAIQADHATHQSQANDGHQEHLSTVHFPNASGLTGVDASGVTALVIGSL